MARILVVEDEVSVQEVLRKVLEHVGHEVELAGDGLEGLACLKRSPPDLLVTDVIMPNMGGIVFIKEVRRLLPELPVVTISGGGRTGRFNFLSTARTFPGVWTLKKPLQVGVFLRLVRDVLSGVASQTPTPERDRATAAHGS